MISVAHTHEFDRIAALPRRTLSIDTACAWANEITPVFALTPEAKLRPWQAQALADAVECDGAWLALAVGSGKTIISWLLPTAMQAARTLLLVPASLLAKTQSDFASYDGVWRRPQCPVRIETRERLATIGGAETLEQYEPDLIILDESDDLANSRSAAVRRIDRYVRTHEPRVVAMTGTPARKSLMGYWHLLAWCLRERAPVPMTESEARMWALAIDDHRGARPAPGPLGGNLSAARAWFCRRLIETPGVVVVDEDSCDAPLTVKLRPANEDPLLNAAFERFLVEQESPGGIPVSDPLSRWLLDGQLGLGLFTRWNPAPPERWRNARRMVARFVRERIEASTHSAHPLDTETQVLRRYANDPTVLEWLNVKPSFDGATETIWITRSTIEACCAWLAESPAPGIIWCGSVDFAIALADATGLRYYGAGGATRSGEALHNAPENASLIASWNANKKGFNLQAWARQLITMPPQSAKWLEQIFGRSHRAGQDTPVIVDVLCTSGGTYDAFDAALSEARNVKATVALTQKLLRASIQRTKPAITDANEYRWATRNEQ